MSYLQVYQQIDFDENMFLTWEIFDVVGRRYNFTIIINNYRVKAKLGHYPPVNSVVRCNSYDFMQLINCYTSFEKLYNNNRLFIEGDMLKGFKFCKECIPVIQQAVTQRLSYARL